MPADNDDEATFADGCAHLLKSVLEDERRKGLVQAVMVTTVATAPLAVAASPLLLTGAVLCGLWKWLDS
jgi:hypothetical protein